jgi:hypothetical protein
VSSLKNRNHLSYRLTNITTSSLDYQTKNENLLSCVNQFCQGSFIDVTAVFAVG